MQDQSDGSPPKRQYPPFYEKAVPIALGLIALTILILLVIVVLVALGLISGTG